MKRILLLILLLSAFPTIAQKLEGVVTYDRTQDYVKIMSRMSFLSLDQKERMKATNKNYSSRPTQMVLYFNEDQSLYTNADEYWRSEDGRWSYRNSDYTIRRDFKQETKSDVIEMLGKTYIIEDSLPTPKWKILNQLKDIAGHICMKAETEDPVKEQKVVAWFAQDIPVSAGPEQYYGLPGLILELDLNDGDVVVTATKIELRDVAKELTANKKIKGKKIKTSDYDKIVKDHIQSSMKAQENPYWSIRY
ncbi:GLPGLI family protein [Larkinella arboricola]|uniref:GLPGLI family protein n=1 Tax=Larkinella arboricola TaxID=643671 RepID=A0A327X1M7_LARAB|nr:GLPGLI family protein [Larkinella arboricola]RAJ98204.1 GLPGLI family protein [Larkinella arboricola]